MQYVIPRIYLSFTDAINCIIGFKTFVSPLEIVRKQNI